MKRVALYVRVSTEEQKRDGLSIDSQISALQDYSKANNYKVVKTYNDAGISARKSYKHRPALLELIEDCKANKIDLILFTKLDRWFRSVADYYEVQSTLDKYNVPWRAIWEDYETETSSGIFKVNIMLSVAQAESDRTSERIKSVNEYRKAKGDYISGKAPTGYKVSKSSIIIDEDKREAVKAFFEEYLSTMNLTSAVKVIHSYGVSIRRDTACRMLHNSAYMGNASGIPCEPYITEEQYNIIQRSISNNRVKMSPPSHNTYIFTGGLLRCEHCNTSMAGTYRHIQGHYYAYYRCNKNRNMACDNSRSITEMKLERELLKNIEKEIENYNISTLSFEDTEIDVDAIIDSLKAKLIRIGDRYEDGDYTRQEYKLKRAEIINEIEKYKNISPSKQKKALPDGWRTMYEELDANHRKAFWYTILSKITISKDGSIKLYF